MDNARIHHGPEVPELCDHFSKYTARGLPFRRIFINSTHFVVGVRVEYLPPYSPDLNPIEEAFSKIKAYLHHHHDYYGATAGAGIMFDMYEVVDIITPLDAVGYFLHAGYF
jgi:hypothetical protein